eukprot:g3584.t1
MELRTLHFELMGFVRQTKRSRVTSESYLDTLAESESTLQSVWIDNRSTDDQEIKFLIEALQEYPNANIEGIVVGNEVIHRNIYLKPLLLGRVTEVRNRVRGLGRYPGYSKLLTVPIFAVEEKPDDDVSANSDMLGLNIHPFYDPNLENADDPEIMSDIILNAAKMQMEKYWNSARHKQLVVTEIGWPSQSSPSDNDLHKGDTILAVRFIEKFSKYCQESGIPYYWFEMFDSLWKKGEYPTAQDSFSEFHFGIYEKDRTNMKKIPGRDRKLKLLK